MWGQRNVKGTSLKRETQRSIKENKFTRIILHGDHSQKDRAGPARTRQKQGRGAITRQANVLGSRRALEQGRTGDHFVWLGKKSRSAGSWTRRRKGAKVLRFRDLKFGILGVYITGSREHRPASADDHSASTSPCLRTGVPVLKRPPAN